MAAASPPSKRARAGSPPARRTLPGSGPANPEDNFFIDVNSDVAYIRDVLGEVKSSYLIRAPPGSGKTTLAQQLGFPYIALNECTNIDGLLDESCVLQRLRDCVKNKFPTEVNVDSLGLADCMVKVRKDSAVVVDEAQLLFELPSSSSLYQSFIKPAVDGSVVLFTTNSEHLRGEKLVISPMEIHKRLYWRAWLPCDKFDHMKIQLEECGILLAIDAIETLAHMCGLHRGIFIKALQWVATKQQEPDREPAWWDCRRLLSEVQRDLTAFQETLFSSRAVRVNGGTLMPPPALQALAESVAVGTAFSAEMLRDALVRGFLRPSQDIGSPEFQVYGVRNDESNYVLANPLQAVHYRGALAEAGVKYEVTPPQRAADVLLRCLPSFLFFQVACLVRSDSSPEEQKQVFYANAKNFPLPHENAWNDFLLVTFNKGLSETEKWATTQHSTSKPDFVWEGDHWFFVIEAVMWDNAVTQHIDRFVHDETKQNTLLYRKNEEPGWHNSRGLWIIGQEEQAVTDQMNKAAKSRVAGSSCDVEVMGVVPQSGYRSMTFLYWQSDSVVFKTDIPCDSVPRKLTTGADGTLRVEVARKVTDWGRITQLKRYVMEMKTTAELADWIRQQFSIESLPGVDLIAQSLRHFTGRMFVQATEEKLAQVIGDRKKSQLNEARFLNDTVLFKQINGVDPLAAAARLIAARDGLDA